MAKIVLGIGTAHTPQLHTMAKDWHIRGDRDKRDGVPMWWKGERLKYAEVEKLRQAEGFNPNLELDYCQSILEKCYTTIDQLHDKLHEVNPDVVLVFGNDQREIFLNDVRPGFTIMACEEFMNAPRTAPMKEKLPPGIEISDHGHLPDSEIRLPGHPELATHIVKELIEDEFDVAISMDQRHPPEELSTVAGMPHAYGFIYEQLFRGKNIPHIPCDLNTFCPPNQPKAARCVKFGQAVGKAVESWDKDLRVAVVATGGLSHFVVDPEFDHDLIDAMVKEDFDRISAYHEGWWQAGTSECKSWVAASAALAGAGLKGTLLDYQALYRTEGGTGSSCAFMTWE